MSPPIFSDTLESTREILRTAYGAEYSDGKMVMLFGMLTESGWSEERFRRTLKWLLRTKPYPAWTPADWYGHEILMHNYAWYTAQCAARNPTITWELAPAMPGRPAVFGYTEAGVDLPFRNVTR